MKACGDCKFAEWYKSETGAYLQSGYGKCTYKYRLPELPHSMKWLGRNPPIHSSGVINRQRDTRTLCAYWKRK